MIAQSCLDWLKKKLDLRWGFNAVENKNVYVSIDSHVTISKYINYTQNNLKHVNNKTVWIYDRSTKSKMTKKKNWKFFDLEMDTLDI